MQGVKQGKAQSGEGGGVGVWQEEMHSKRMIQLKNIYLIEDGLRKA